VAQPILMAARNVMWIEAHVRLIPVLHFQSWPTQRERVGLVDTPVLFFAVCRPKFTQLSAHAQHNLQFPTPFSVRRYLVSFRRYSRSSCQVVRNLPQNLTFWGRQFYGGRATNFWPQSPLRMAYCHCCGRNLDYLNTEGHSIWVL